MLNDQRNKLQATLNNYNNNNNSFILFKAEWNTYNHELMSSKYSIYNKNL